MKETTILRATMLSGSQAGATLWRNNVGVATFANGARVVYGLCPGSSDIIGLTPIVIQPEHVGHTVAVFTAIETKAVGVATAGQTNFLNHVATSGGIAILARGDGSPAEVADLIEEARQGHIQVGVIHDTGHTRRGAHGR